MSIPQEIHIQLQKEQSFRIKSTSPIGGGCIHNGLKLETEQGDFFLKYNRLYSLANFQAEEKGLAVLADTKEINTPRVDSSGSTENYAYLLMEFIEPGIKSLDYWEDFGQRLAELHLNTQTSFGLDHDNYIGALSQSNTPHESWADFFINERISPMVEMAIAKGAFRENIRDTFERLYVKVPDIFPEEAPALIHGDLWGGNILTDKTGKVCLIDPAVYYGHREMELSFMTLFDSQPLEFYKAYDEVYPLQEDFASRFDVYNLYPLLVHVNLFGGGYADSVRRILKELV